MHAVRKNSGTSCTLYLSVTVPLSCSRCSYCTTVTVLKYQYCIYCSSSCSISIYIFSWQILQYILQLLKILQYTLQLRYNTSISTGALWGVNSQYRYAVLEYSALFFQSLVTSGIMANLLYSNYDIITTHYPYRSLQQYCRGDFWESCGFMCSEQT